MEYLGNIQGILWGILGEYYGEYSRNTWRDTAEYLGNIQDFEEYLGNTWGILGE